MRQYIESLILGFLIACVSLLFQVFISVIIEILFDTSTTLHYDPSSSTQMLFASMFVIAVIEELVRTFCIYIKYDPKKTSLTHKQIFGYGILLGFGFFLCEIALALINPQIKGPMSMILLSPMFLHIFLSMWILYVSHAYHMRKIIIFLMFFTAVIIHACANILMYLIMN